MKRLLSVFVILVSIILLSACGVVTKNQTGNELVKNNEAKEEINELEIKNIKLVDGSKSRAINLYIKKSKEKSITIKMQESLENEIKVDYSSTKLIISADSSAEYNTNKDFEITISGYVFDKISLSNGTNAKLDNEVLSKDNIYFDLSGASIINAKEIISNKLEADLSGASSLTINKLELEELNAELSGASIAMLKGKAKNIDIELSGASLFKDYEFACDFGEANLSGASILEITANNELSGSVSGASNVRYMGKATNKMDVSDSSTVTGNN